ncbi:ABC transporter substrate-binding protein [Caldalkalibacillus salinus]|uniref:ABC transporter substrate-binding protein n=1 Tax=Caldalkalibacillus salinus TaxID=2803787 RepID=UPI00192326C9|nr:sugar ABC transporter substrate-binding protein [Caldalkalibacillus salinus]
MFKKGKSKFSITVVFLMVALLLSACTSSEPSSQDTDGQSADGEDYDVEFRFLWWGNQDRHDRTLALIDRYEELNPHVKIHPEFLGFSDYADRLATQVAGGNAPDLFQMVDRWLPMYATRGQLADLQPYIDSDVINTEHINQSSLDPGYIDDELVGLSTGSNTFALVYDPDLFEEADVPVLEPGYTWEEFADTARLLAERLDMYGTYVDVNHARSFGHYLLQHAQWLYNEEGTGLGWEDEQLFVDFMNYWLDLEEEGVVPPADVVESANTIENYLIVNEQAPMQIIHSNQIVAVTNAADREFEMTILPSHENGNTGAYVRASMFFSMSPDTEHPEEVAKFMDWMTNDVEANEIIQGDRGVPVSSAIREHLYSNVERTVQQQFDYIDLIADYAGDVPPPPPPAGSELDDVFDRAFYNVLYKAMTPEEAVETYRQEKIDVINRQ